MKIKHILLSLVCATSVVSAAHTQQHPQQQQRAPNTVAVTGSDLLGMFRYFDRTYFPLIESLREKQRVSRDDIIRAYEHDRFLNRAHNGGNALFKHTILPLYVGAVDHGNTDIVGPNERKQHHKSLQVYVNVIKIFIQEVVNPRKAMNAQATMDPAQWNEEYGAPLEEAARKFNATTKAEWSSMLAMEEAAFEVYSREEEKHILKEKEKK